MSGSKRRHRIGLPGECLGGEVSMNLKKGFMVQKYLRTGAPPILVFYSPYILIGIIVVWGICPPPPPPPPILGSQ